MQLSLADTQSTRSHPNASALSLTADDMDSVQLEVQKFRTALATTPDLWRSLSIHGIAVRREEEWHNVMLIVRLHHEDAAGDTSVETLARTDSLWAYQQTVPFEALDLLFTQLQIGILSLGSETVRVTAMRGIGQPRGPYSLAYTRLCGPLQESLLAEASVTGHSLRLNGDQATVVSEHLPGGLWQLDDELRAAQEPWDGLAALSRYGLGMQRPLDPHTGVGVEIVAPITVRLRTTTCELRRGILRVSLEGSSPQLRALCTVGYIGTDGERLGSRGTLDFRSVHWLPHAGTVSADESIKIGDHERATLFLRIGPWVVDRATVVNARIRERRVFLRSYELNDPELNILSERLLLSQGSDQDNFERAVARTMLFAGLVIDSFVADKRFKDAPDLLAHAPEQRVLLVVECTTGPLQSKDGKLSRLVARSRAIVAALDQADDTKVIPVIITSLAAADVAQSDRAAAEADGIVVLDNQGLSELLALARTGAGATATLTPIQRRQPGAGLVSRFFGR